MAEVALEQVTKTYDGSARAVDHVSLTIADQEFVVLVGPSGCGKSTLLRMIAGLEAVTQGKISIGGRVVNDVLPKDRDVAMVFQNYALYPHMSVRQNMAFGLKLRKLPRRDIDQRIESAAKMLAIEELLQRKPRELSGGQRQRVAVGRAIVRQPAVFLFDEPLSNLDALRRTEMRRELADLHRRLTATIVYVTHDQVEAMTLGDRIVVMNAGQIQQVGRPLELYDHPANRFVAGFLGSPPMNFLDGEIVSEQGRLRFQADAISLPIPEELSLTDSKESPQPVTLGIRPEHLSISSRSDNTAQISATIEDIQPLGGESLIYLNTGAAQWVLRTDAHHDFARGGQVSVVVEMSRAHLFDSSGQAIPPRTPTVDQAS